jgi:hypothetical protein
MKSWLTTHCLLNLAIVMMAVLVLSADVMACPTCKNGMSGGDPVSVARASGYFYSILFMMSMPFLIVGTFGGAAYLSIKRARERELTRE